MDTHYPEEEGYGERSKKRSIIIRTFYQHSEQQFMHTGGFEQWNLDIRKSSKRCQEIKSISLLLREARERQESSKPRATRRAPPGQYNIKSRDANLAKFALRKILEEKK
ncbi:hypothetical protein M8J76_016195 [Diaphorina citri]|nr:hypothetical protein M8J76_016195 [Diaphorina citri]